MPSSCWSQSSLLSLPILRQIRQWEVVEPGRISKARQGARKAISYRTQSVTSLNQHQAPSFSSQPKPPDHRNIPPDRHLATLATQTKGGVRLSLPGLHARNRVLD
jgi:hypothetical protein